ncbi:Protein of unknown function [Bacteroides faecichinchillae]|uniref:DUF1573 domain-containing protein n=2 Tax=Bacteroides faecichinchillae TaxID=871325 RepID=A0A1M4SJ43_9BACE|nr:DUF1573 domain-containing protein [Bacteroides faecichinchillae]SHE32007.1 Protein of unknown function [Bacteroides faecichinchillae]
MNMRRIKEYFIYLLIMFISIISILFALTKPSKEKPILPIDVGLNHTFDSISQVKFSGKVVNFGVVPADTVLKAKFILYNVGKYPLKIEGVNPDCSCTDYFLSDDIVSVGDSTLLVLIYSTKDKLGEQELHTIIKMNTTEKMYKVTLKADIES